ncbi:MAG: YebC/PmpR family DNA-binding transcriptional regulator, partial [archaeon]|nr:YebC/PmpR family DNA-binding transcriptional regulator [archaeon]
MRAGTCGHHVGVEVARAAESRRWAGHSHFHNIKHKKAANDSKRAVQYAKLSNEIQAATRAGGGDTSQANVRLQSVLSKARAMNMPK